MASRDPFVMSHRHKVEPLLRESSVLRTCRLSGTQALNAKLAEEPSFHGVPDGNGSMQPSLATAASSLEPSGEKRTPSTCALGKGDGANSRGSPPLRPTQSFPARTNASVRPSA